MRESEVVGISREELFDRQARARALAGEEGLQGLVVVGRSAYDRPGHLAYLTNHYPPFPTSQFTETDRGGGHGIFVLPVDGEPILLIDRQSEASLRKDVVAADDVRVAPDMVTALIDVLREHNLQAAQVGIAGEDILPAPIYRDVVAALPNIRFRPADSIVNRLRLIKSEQEIALLRRGAELTGVAHAVAVETVKPGVREIEVCAEGIRAALREGADFVRYFRVSSDPQLGTTMRWPQASDRVIEDGDIVMMDIIGAYKGYQFDVFRCTVAGTASPEGRRMMDAVLEATDACVAAVRPGVVAEEVVAVARQVFSKYGYADYSRTFMGHGIGIETVEPPFISPGDTTVLQEGMVLCIEPGLRIPGLGGCTIEQEIVVRERGPELLTTFPTKFW